MIANPATPAKDEQKDVERIVSEANEGRLEAIVQKFSTALPNAVVTGKACLTSIKLVAEIPESAMPDARRLCDEMIEPISYPDITVFFKKA